MTGHGVKAVDNHVDFAPFHVQEADVAGVMISRVNSPGASVRSFPSTLGNRVDSA